MMIRSVVTWWRPGIARRDTWVANHEKQAILVLSIERNLDRELDVVSMDLGRQVHGAWEAADRCPKWVRDVLARSPLANESNVWAFVIQEEP